MKDVFSEEYTALLLDLCATAWLEKQKTFQLLSKPSNVLIYFIYESIVKTDNV